MLTLNHVVTCLEAGLTNEQAIEFLLGEPVAGVVPVVVPEDTRLALEFNYSLVVRYWLDTGCNGTYNYLNYGSRLVSKLNKILGK